MHLSLQRRIQVILLENRRKESASITVFFSLVCILIFAMLGTIIEGARFKVCEVHAYRTLRMAVESLFTEYNRPLFEEYRLFLIENAGKSFPVSIADYAADTISPEKSLNTIDLFGGSLEDVSIEDIQYAGDCKANAIRTEISEYMKRHLVKSSFVQFKNKLCETESLNEKGESLERRIEAERKSAEFDIVILKLMRLIDGVYIKPDGNIGGEKYFMKMFCLGNKRMENLGINNLTVWDAVRKNLIEVETDVTGQKHFMDQFQQAVERCIPILEEAIQLVYKMERQMKDVSQMQQNEELYYKKYADGNLKRILRGNKRVLEDTVTVLNDCDEAEKKERLETLWKAYDCRGISFDYRGISERGGESNPGDSLKAAMNKGILNLVAKNADKISNKMVDEADMFCRYYEAEDLSGDYEKNIQNFIEKEKVQTNNLLGNVTGYVWDEFCIDRYLEKFCGGAAGNDRNMDKVLAYEMEYIIAGKKSDSENLGAVVSRLLLLRTVANFGTLWSSAERRDTAYAAAAAIVGFTGMEPLIRLTQSILMVVWAMSESLVDVAALLQGKNVPIIKRSQQLQMDFRELFGIRRELIQKKAKEVQNGGLSMNYKDYLHVFFVSESQSIKLYRLMDLIQWNMEKKYNHNFQLQNTVYSITVKGSFCFQTRFFRMPVIKDMLGRNLTEFYITPSTKYTY